MAPKRLRRPAVTADGNEEIAELPRSPVPRGDRRSRSRHRRDHLPPTGESPGRELEEQLKDDSDKGPAPAAALDSSHGQESVKSTVSKKTKFPHMDVKPGRVDTALESTQLPTPTKGMRFPFIAKQCPGRVQSVRVVARAWETKGDEPRIFFWQ